MIGGFPVLLFSILLKTTSASLYFSPTNMIWRYDFNYSNSVNIRTIEVSFEFITNTISFLIYILFLYEFIKKVTFVI